MRKDFEMVVKDICAKTKTKVPIVKPYRLRIYTGWCSGSYGNFRISYHPEKILKYSYSKFLNLVAHEVGHIRTWSGDRTTSEYKAELFALRVIKKYYPKYFTLRHTKAVIKRNQKWYSEAFQKALKEFKKD